ncbi:elongation factor P hydroxylase [Aliidiomarina sanyensis]|uniref:ABC transporter ATP-binding protein n=1 Tax=Aliidiomarina sanyensis TaxID=1249555 RepID=A0A432WEN7_9GAMM|nr:elongation factor P hydroxylase [Aliidiomarina sanyensis]RUO31325.1 ABC transporter ATP-binding protein [Aliidiomarina sanyensis]
MTSTEVSQTHSTPLQADHMIRLFNSCFQDSEQTVLIGGATEPLYAPNSNRYPYHRIFFAHDYVRSSLHEIAHWMLAGKVRRHLLDYGYWYAPDGRTPSQQAAFEAVEVQPQAMEWILSLAAGVAFEVSLDNLSGDCPPDRVAFTNRVLDCALARWLNGLPPRVEQFLPKLLEATGQERWTHAQLLEAAQKLRAVEHERAKRSGQSCILPPERIEKERCCA